MTLSPRRVYVEMFQAVKSYLFSNPKLFGESFDIEKERQKLFLGESELVQDVKED